MSDFSERKVNASCSVLVGKDGDVNRGRIHQTQSFAAVADGVHSVEDLFKGAAVCAGCQAVNVGTEDQQLGFRQDVEVVIRERHLARLINERGGLHGHEAQRQDQDGFHAHSFAVSLGDFLKKIQADFPPLVKFAREGIAGSA